MRHVYGEAHDFEVPPELEAELSESIAEADRDETISADELIDRLRQIDAAASMESSITGFHQDEESHWVAELECGHFQHVRHNPPWMSRPWVLTPDGRASMIGFKLQCKKCDLDAPPDGR